MTVTDGIIIGLLAGLGIAALAWALAWRRRVRHERQDREEKRLRDIEHETRMTDARVHSLRQRIDALERTKAAP